MISGYNDHTLNYRDCEFTSTEFPKREISFNDQASPSITQTQGILKKTTTSALTQGKRQKPPKNMALGKTPLEIQSSDSVVVFVASLQRLIMMMSFQALSDLILR